METRGMETKRMGARRMGTGRTGAKRSEAKRMKTRQTAIRDMEKRKTETRNMDKLQMRHQPTALLRLIRLFLLMLAALPVLLASPAPAGAQDLGDHDIVSFEKSPEMLERLRRLDLDLLMERDGRIYAVVGARDLLRLTVELVPFRIDTASAPSAYPAASRLSTQGGINGDFHSYGEAERELFLLEETYPAIARVYDVGDSLEGRNLYAVKLSDNVGTDENEAEVLLLGCHHAREWIAVDVPLMIAQHLASHYASDPEIRSLLDQSEVWILPVVNPDGLEYSIHVYRYWRKNRRDNGNGSFGVDLNRNYGYQWGYDDTGSSGNTNSGIYRGTAPFSEPESLAVRDLVEAHDFLALVSYHSYGRIILYPWGYIMHRAPQDAVLEYLASSMSARMAAVHGATYRYGPAGNRSTPRTATPRTGRWVRPGCRRSRSSCRPRTRAGARSSTPRRISSPSSRRTCRRPCF